MKKKEFRDRYSLQIKIHYNLFIAVLICMLFGALMQYSASNASIAILKKSLSFILISLIAFALIQNLNIRNFILSLKFDIIFVDVSITDTSCNRIPWS